MFAAGGYGNGLFFASLCWRSRQGVNGWGRVHLVTPAGEKSATTREVTGGALSSKTFTIPDWGNQDYTIDDSDGGSNFPLGGPTPPGETIHQAYAGVVRHQAIIPADAHPALGSTQLGVEEALVGLAPFYLLQYVGYIVAMNTTSDQTFTFQPKGSVRTIDLSTGHRVAPGKPIRVKPRTTVVLFDSRVRA